MLFKSDFFFFQYTVSFFVILVISSYVFCGVAYSCANSALTISNHLRFDDILYSIRYLQCHVAFFWWFYVSYLSFWLFNIESWMNYELIFSQSRSIRHRIVWTPHKKLKNSTTTVLWSRCYYSNILLFRALVHINNPIIFNCSVFIKNKFKIHNLFSCKFFSLLQILSKNSNANRQPIIMCTKAICMCHCHSQAIKQC